MHALDVRDEALVLGVPDRFFRDWVDDHYRGLLEDALTKTLGSPARISYEVVEAPSKEQTLPAGANLLDGPHPNRLNDRFTFQTYVVADSNQLPAAAAA